MLFLLRQIRRKLLSNKKVTTYLLYAIGEIFLVVIGILIAVSIDDWNQGINNREKEIKYLKRIKLDLEKDLAQLEDLMIFRQEKKEGSEVVLAHMKGVDQDETEVIRHIGNSIYERNFTPNNTTYNELSNSGNQNLISSDSIKILLLELQNLYQRNQGMIEHETFDYHEYVSKELTTYADLNRLIPISYNEKTAEELGISITDFEPLLNNVRYKNGMHIMVSMSNGFLELYMNISNKSQIIISLIDEELNTP